MLCPAVPVCGTGRPRSFRFRLCIPRLCCHHLLTGLAQTVLLCHLLTVPGRIRFEEPLHLPAALWWFSSSASASLFPGPLSSLPRPLLVLTARFPCGLPVLWALLRTLPPPSVRLLSPASLQDQSSCLLSPATLSLLLPSD